MVEVDPETTGGSGGELAIVVDSPVVFLVYYGIGPGGALGVQLRCTYIYPDGLVGVVDDPLEDAPGAGAELALHGLHICNFVVCFELREHPAALALPAVVGEGVVGLVDFPAVVFDVDGGLAEGAGDHEVLVDGFVGEAGLAMARGLGGGRCTIRTFYSTFFN